MNRWHYLTTPPFKARYVLAAHWLRHLPVIVEVGGWKNCVAEFLPSGSPAVVYAVDPLLAIPEFPAVVQFKKELKDIQLPQLPKPYGVVALGFDVEEGPNFETLVGLAEEADTIVLESALRYPPSADGVEMLIARLDRSLHLTLKMDMTGSPLELPPDSSRPFLERQMYVLK